MATCTLLYQWSSQQDATSPHGGVQDATKEQCIRIPTWGGGGGGGESKLHM